MEKPEQLNNAALEGRRLYVGGLPRFLDQVITNSKIRELFQGFNVEVMSKMISPHISEKDDRGNHYYCSVDLAAAEDVDAAISALDGKEKWNWTIKVNRAGGISGNLG